MRKTSLALAVAAVILLSLTVPSLVPAADQRSGPGKAQDQRACEKACHDDHRRWVDLCISNHNPREITPSARGQCVETGAERLRQCLKGCR
jgi:hypothetical protein